MPVSRFRTAFVFSLAAACALGACSGGGSSPSTPKSQATPTPAPSTAPSAGGATPTPKPTITPTPNPAATPTPTPAPGASALVSVNTATSLATISPIVLGANMAAWFDQTQSGIASSLTGAGFSAVRYPGGSTSDQYHWEGAGATPASPTTCGGAYVNPNSTFDTFMNDVALPGKLDVAITLDYGSNAACNGGGDPSEAAAWVDYANNVKHYGINWWTVGNEEFGSWEYDLHSSPHNAATYANAVATGFYPAIKAKDASAMVGVVVQPGWSPAWDPTVLASAKYDFVELHWYAQQPGAESDSYLLDTAPGALASTIASLKSELASAGKSVPIYVGEMGSVSSNPGKQSMSITQALFAAQVIGQLLDAGIARSTWWLAYGGCSDPSSGGNYSSSLYGWQNFGGYIMLSDGLPEGGCSSAPAIPRGTLLPTGVVYQVASHLATAGEHVYATSVNASLPNVRAFAASHGTGYSVMLINLDENNPATVPVGIGALASGSGGTIVTYGKAQYDESKTNVWAGSVSSTFGTWHGTFTVSLPAWSVSVVTVTP